LTITCHHLSHADPWTKGTKLPPVILANLHLQQELLCQMGNGHLILSNIDVYTLYMGFCSPDVGLFPHCQAEWLNGMPKWLSRGFNGALGACLNQHRRVGLVHAASCYSVLTENYYVLLQDAGSNFPCKEHVCHFLPMKCRTMKCFFHVHACD